MPHDNMPESIPASVARAHGAPPQGRDADLGSPVPGLRLVAWMHRLVGTHLVNSSKGVRIARDYEPMPCEVVMVEASR